MSIKFLVLEGGYFGFGGGGGKCRFYFYGRENLSSGNGTSNARQNRKLAIAVVVGPSLNSSSGLDVTSGYAIIFARVVGGFGHFFLFAGCGRLAYKDRGTDSECGKDESNTACWVF